MKDVELTEMQERELEARRAGKATEEQLARVQARVEQLEAEKVRDDAVCQTFEDKRVHTQSRPRVQSSERFTLPEVKMKS